MESYGTEIKEGEDKGDNEHQLVAGSVYDGLIFTFGNSGKVTAIFLGAAAE